MCKTIKFYNNIEKKFLKIEKTNCSCFSLSKEEANLNTYLREILCRLCALSKKI